MIWWSSSPRRSRARSARRHPEGTGLRDHLGTLLLALVLLVAGCRSVSIRGVIQTADEQPIANASVTLRPGESAGHALDGSSEPNGCFDLFETISRHQDGYILVVDSPGYKPLRIAVAVRLENLLLITLEPTASSKPSAARPIRSAERYIRYGVPCDTEFSAHSLTLH
jgi:hypothetical protein